MSKQTEHPSFKLIAGVGKYADGTACIMSAAVALYRFKKGEPLGEATDQLDCACRVIREFCIKINDAGFWISDEQRTEVLSPYIERLLDTAGSLELRIKRAFICADFAVRKFAPFALRKAGLEDQAVKLESLPQITSDAAAAAAAADDAARYAAAAARYAAAAAADAARYAAARYDAAAARYAAARYAADAGDAAAARYAADAARYAGRHAADGIIPLIKQLMDALIEAR